MDVAAFRARRGFTLVELLVVIAIIGILVALLLPAVQSAREAARRLQCSNNLKQLALACHGYHAALGKFPPSVVFDAGQDPEYNNNFRPNWVILILPYLEQQPLFDAFDFTKPISDAVNSNARGTRLGVMACPTDTGHDVFFPGNGGNWARGNYAANAGDGFLRRYNGSNPNTYNSSKFDLYGESSVAWKDRQKRGVMGGRVSVSIAEIRDGTTHTFLIGEVRVGLLPALDRRGTWAMGAAGASSLWAFGVASDANAPNMCIDKSDDIEGCHDAFNADPNLYRRECMQCIESARSSAQATMRSRHVGGVQAAMCDGSVHFISNSIETSPPWGTFGSVWDRLLASADGMVLDSAKAGF